MQKIGNNINNRKSMRTFSFLVLCLMGFFFVACDENEDRLGDWARGAAFPGEPRNQAVSFQIGDYMYVGLGIGVNGAEYKNFYKYNLKTGIWDNTQPVTDFEGEARHAAVAFVLDGKAYVGLGFRVGRYYSDVTVNRKYFYDFWEYDPTLEGTGTNPWRQIDDYPGHDKESEANPEVNDGGGRRDAIAFTVEGDSYGYVGLGRGYNDMVYNEIYSYSPSTGWSSAPIPFNGEARYGASVFVVDGAAYICLGATAGGSYSTENWKFVPDGNGGGTFTAMQALREKPDNRQDQDYDRIPRAYGVAFVSNAGKDGRTYGYIALGRGANASTTWRYDHEYDRWHQVEGLSSSQSTLYGAVAFSVPVGSTVYGMYTTGGGQLDGTQASSSYLNESWWFYPDVKEWRGNDYSTTEIGNYRHDRY